VFSSWGLSAVEQAAEKICAVSVLGGFQDLPGQSPEPLGLTSG